MLSKGAQPRVALWRAFDWVICLGLTLALAIGCFTVSTTYAQIDPSLFELDGNVADSPAGPPADWRTLNPPDPEGAGGSFARTYLPDSGTPNETFTQGSKDTRDIPRWRWAIANNVLDKNDILNAYAAAYMNGEDLILVFGLDREAVDGAASVGFWFFQDDVEMIGGGEFKGEHKDGDVLVTATFGGSGVDEIQVYEWSGGGIIPKSSVTNTDCPSIASPNNNDACGETNLETLEGNDDRIDWTFQSKNAASPNVAPPGSFFEGAINYSDLIPGDSIPCFNSFMATTRTSPSVTASIKNFVLGDFNLCNISVTKVCDVRELINPSGPTFRTYFTATVTNDGPGDFQSDQYIRIIDDAGDGFYGEAGLDNDVVVTRLISELAPNGQVQPGGNGSLGFKAGDSLIVYFDTDSETDYTGFFDSGANPPTNAVKALILDSDGTSVITQDVLTGVDCDSLDLTTAIFVEKSCSDVKLTKEAPSGSTLRWVGIQVGYSMRVCNTSSHKLFDVRLDDDTAGVHTSGTDLAAGVLCSSNDDCDPLSGRTASCIGAGAGPGVCVFDVNPELGPDGEGSFGKVCEFEEGDYLITTLGAGVTTADPGATSFSNSATATAPQSSNPLLLEDLTDTSTTRPPCPLCPPPSR